MGVFVFGDKHMYDVRIFSIYKIQENVYSGKYLPFFFHLQCFLSFLRIAPDDEVCIQRQ